jgi:acetyl-CoA carboxylase carboxyltransferase component
VADHLAQNDAHALALARQAVGSLNRQKNSQLKLREPAAPLFDAKEIYGVIPADSRKPYDVREIIARIVDGSEFAEFKARFGATLVCGFAHIEGMPVGIICPAPRRRIGLASMLAQRRLRPTCATCLVVNSSSRNSRVSTHQRPQT